MRLSGGGETHDFPLTIYSDYSYQYDNESGRWSYSGNQLTITSTEGSITFTIEGRYGNGYSGHAVVYGTPYQAVLMPQ